MACHPQTGKTKFFVDKNLAFGHTISCSLFQKFSDSLRHILEGLTGRAFCCVNYLDDYLFIQLSADDTNYLVSEFLEICSKIHCPVALDKTTWWTFGQIFWTVGARVH